MKRYIPSFKGRKHTAESLAKMRLANKGENHPNWGRKFSKEHRKNLSISKRGNKNAWLGDAAGYAAIHIWVNKYLKKPKLCSSCKKKKPLDAANISQKYLRKLTDYEWLCRSCHIKKDGRFLNFKKQGPRRMLEAFHRA